MKATDNVQEILGHGVWEAPWEASDASGMGVNAWLSGSPELKAVSGWKIDLFKFFLG